MPTRVCVAQYSGVQIVFMSKVPLLTSGGHIDTAIIMVLVHPARPKGVQRSAKFFFNIFH